MNSNSGTLPQKAIAGYSGSYSGRFKTMSSSAGGGNRREQLAGVLLENRKDIEFSPKHPRLWFAVDLAYKLIHMSRDDPLQLALEVWLDILFYAANRCSRESHAKKLSSGSELTTIVWLMAENRHYLRKYQAAKRQLPQ
jgi:hypothetical protein